MGIFKKKTKKRDTSQALLVNDTIFGELLQTGYTPLSRNPEVMAGVNTIADLISSQTIHLMANSKNGDVRIQNELSKKVDIYPNEFMTRKTFIWTIVRALLLEGKGNAVVLPEFENGLLKNLIPVEPSRIVFQKKTKEYGYTISVDGKPFDPDRLLHFVINPSPEYPFWGTGYQMTLKEVARSLDQAMVTKNGFMESKWKPNMIIKVDGMVDEFSTEEGRDAILQSYIKNTDAGKPWLLPAEQFDVKEVRPLSLNDIALIDSVKLDKQSVASILGVPSFVLGEGAYNELEWNHFINTKIAPLCKVLEQELTKKLLISPNWYFRFNCRSLYAYDIQKLSQVGGDNYVRGIMTGNEIRDWLGLSPLDGLDELVILENYIPASSIGDQKKLNQTEQDSKN